MAQGDRPYAIRELSQSKFVDYTARSLSTMPFEVFLLSLSKQSIFALVLHTWTAQRKRAALAVYICAFLHRYCR